MSRSGGWFAMASYTLALASGLTWASAWLLTDRWTWSQWIWWFPWLGYALACVPALVASLVDRGGSRRRFRRGAVVSAVVISAVGLVRDVGLTARPAARPETVRIVQWNASWVDAGPAADPSSAILALDADLVVLSNPWQFFRSRRGAWAEQGYDVVQTGTFAFASRRPILEARPLPAPAGCFLAIVRIDAGLGWPRPLTLLAVDLPSAPQASRRELATRLAAWTTALDLPPIDAVLGDFNITRGSGSLAVAFPDHREAFGEAGSGWGASFEEPRPLFHIDLLLAGPDVRVAWCRLWTVGPRHRAQETWIEPGNG